MMWREISTNKYYFIFIALVKYLYDYTQLCAVWFLLTPLPPPRPLREGARVWGLPHPPAQKPPVTLNIVQLALVIYLTVVLLK